MEANLSNINFIVGDMQIIKNMEKLPSLTLYNDIVIQYLDCVSKILLKNSNYPDVVTFGFWCRKASVLSQRKEYDISSRLGRGIAFHVAPSNVAVNFGYSLVIGLLSGNSNIIRVSSKHFPQTQIICEALLLAIDKRIQPYIGVVQYEHDKYITDYFSSICDTRIIWGGDSTINNIRTSPLKPRSTEITFADRYSICVINSDAYSNEKNKKTIAEKFFNDTYLTDQNACTSPKLVIWLGKTNEDFWENLHKVVKEKYILKPVQSVDKLAKMYMQASEGHFHFKQMNDNYIYRIFLDKLSPNIMKINGNSGYFMEYECSSINDMLPVINSMCQTLACYGIDINQTRNFIMENGLKGIDRVVSIGQTMDFSSVWDGFDLIISLSRKIWVNNHEKNG